jgi:pyrroloquinoline quinone biosynthesis protein B
MRMKILGSGQDGGIPHTGCYCDVCLRARSHPEYGRLSPSAAIFEKEDSFCYLIDASPDFKYQLDMIRKDIAETRRGGRLPLDGILLTHGHFGHVAGLLHLGREVVEETDLPVFTTPEMSHFLKENFPFSLLIQNRNIRFEEIHPEERFELEGVKFLPIEVPHRNEIGDTVAYVIESRKKVLYVPDMDRWTCRLVEEIGKCDVAFVDGTFYSREEVPRFEDVPHPPIQETIRLLEDVAARIWFTHINHTNPVNKEGNEKEYVEREGFGIVNDGMVIEL